MTYDAPLQSPQLFGVQTIEQRLDVRACTVLLSITPQAPQPRPDNPCKTTALPSNKQPLNPVQHAYGSLIPKIATIVETWHSCTCCNGLKYRHSDNLDVCAGTVFLSITLQTPQACPDNPHKTAILPNRKQLVEPVQNLCISSVGMIAGTHSAYVAQLQ